MPLPFRSPRLRVQSLFAPVVILCLLSPAQAADLRVPEAFDVLQVNGREFSLSLQREKKIPLQTGVNEIVLEYDHIFDRPGSDSHDRFVSLPIRLRFVSDGAQDLRVQARVPERHEDAAAFARAPQLQVQTLAGAPVTLLAAATGTVIGTASGTQPAPAPESAPATQQTAPVSTAGTVTDNSPARSPSALATPAAEGHARVETAPVASPVTPPDALQMLHYWWQQATPAQRQAFLQQLKR